MSQIAKEHQITTSEASECLPLLVSQIAKEHQITTLRSRQRFGPGSVSNRQRTSNHNYGVTIQGDIGVSQIAKEHQITTVYAVGGDGA